MSNDDCLVCGASAPSLHVAVRSADGEQQVGSICDGHTLREILGDPRERLVINVRLDEYTNAERQVVSDES
jgi:hypothetical protein